MSLVHRKLKKNGRPPDQLLEAYVEALEGKVVSRGVPEREETLEEGMRRLEGWREKQEERERLKGEDGVERWVKE